MKNHLRRHVVMSALAPILAWGLYPRPLLAQEDGSLWDRAVEVAGRNERWVPGTILEREVVTNRHGKVEQVTERHIRIVATPRGSIEVELVKEVLDGEDVTSQARDRFEQKAQVEYLSEDQHENPFALGVQGRIQLLGPGRPDPLEHMACERFSYRQASEDAEWWGEAWLERSTGTPLRLRFQTEGPFEEDGATITNLTGSIVFHHGGPEEWYPRELSYSMDIDTRIFPLVRFRGYLETTLSLQDHFLLH